MCIDIDNQAVHYFLIELKILTKINEIHLNLLLNITVPIVEQTECLMSPDPHKSFHRE